MTWFELYKIIRDNLKNIKNDTVRVYDESTGDFEAVELIQFDDDDVIDKQNLFLWRQEKCDKTD